MFESCFRTLAVILVSHLQSVKKKKIIFQKILD